MMKCAVQSHTPALCIEQIIYFCNHVYVCTIVLPVLSLAMLEIGFGEVDFYQEEGNGNITVSIIKKGPLNSDLYLNIIPLTFDEFDARGYMVPEERRNVQRPDPAECR